MALANLFFGGVPVLVKVATGAHHSAAQITFIRFVVSLGLALGLIALSRRRFDVVNLRLLVWRGVFGGLAVLGYFYAIELTTAAKGTLLNYTHSLWANLIAVVLLKHRPPRGFWWLLGLAGVGLWLVIDPHFQTFTLGDGVGLLSGVMGGAAVMTIKELRRTDAALTIFTFFSLIGIPFALLPSLVRVVAGAAPFEGWSLPDLGGWGLILGLSALAMVGQVLFTFAYKFTSLALGTVLSLSVPVLSALGGWYFLREPLTPHFLLGGALILIACGGVGALENAHGKADARRRFDPMGGAASPAPVAASAVEDGEAGP